MHFVVYQEVTGKIELVLSFYRFQDINNVSRIPSPPLKTAKHRSSRRLHRPAAFARSTQSVSDISPSRPSLTSTVSPFEPDIPPTPIDNLEPSSGTTGTLDHLSPSQRAMIGAPHGLFRIRLTRKYLRIPSSQIPNRTRETQPHPTTPHHTAAPPPPGQPLVGALTARSRPSAGRARRRRPPPPHHCPSRLTGVRGVGGRRRTLAALPAVTHRGTPGPAAGHHRSPFRRGEMSRAVGQPVGHSVAAGHGSAAAPSAAESRPGVTDDTRVSTAVTPLTEMSAETSLPSHLLSQTPSPPSHPTSSVRC